MVKQRERIGAHSPEILGGNGQPVLRCAPDWKGPILERRKILGSMECGPQSSGMPTVIASKASHPCRRWYRYNGKTIELPLGTGPGVDTLGATYERDHGRWECDPGGETICLRLSPQIVHRYLQEEAWKFDLELKYSFEDGKLVQAIFSLADEIQEGFPNGTLYAEGISLTIFGWLTRHHAIKPVVANSRAKGLTAAEQARIRELVDASLGGDLTVETMAASVGISPFYFSRLFRASFGIPPYQYVLQMRIARAARLLRADRHRGVADIAMDVGFASQSHLSDAFKRYMGQTPARWRWD